MSKYLVKLADESKLAGEYFEVTANDPEDAKEQALIVSNNKGYNLPNVLAVRHISE